VHHIHDARRRGCIDKSEGRTTTSTAMVDTRHLPHENSIRQGLDAGDMPFALNGNRVGRGRGRRDIGILQSRRNDACRGNQGGGPDVVAPVARLAKKSRIPTKHDFIDSNSTLW
jgi:hypothetical protein